MVKFICHHSFIAHYVENFFNDNNRESAELINHNKILIIDAKTLTRLKELYGTRELMLDTILDLCHIINIDAGDEIATLIRIAGITTITDQETYVRSEDSYINVNLQKKGIQALTCTEAIKKIQ